MITDHDHVVQRTRGDKGFVKFGCGLCGKSNMSHLSWGRQVADRIGGSPLDYVDRDEER